MSTCVRRFAIVAAFAVATGLAGCHYLRQPVDPQPSAWQQLGAEPAGSLLVLLPGIGDRLGAFSQAGFVDDLRQSGQDFDVVEVDAHFGYYRTGRLADTLHRDVILPARQRGYRDIVLLGVSMGGYGALWYNHVHPGVARQLVLFAPFLGDEELITTLQETGVDDWYQRETGPFDESELVWRWIVEDLGEGSAVRAVSVLAYGRRDNFAEAAELLAQRLPATQLVTSDGGHDWNSWRVLWRELLERGLLESG